MSQSGPVVFGDFTFDPASGELTRDGRKVRLQRQPSRLLELLIARRGAVVTRDEIRQALWGADTHVDFERSLNFCVAKLRAALRDDAASPRFVETVPTRGYRFVAACEAASTEPGAGSRKPEAESGEPRAESREPGAGSRELEADSGEPEAESRELEAGSGEPQAGSRQPHAPRAPSWRTIVAGLAATLLIVTGIAAYAYRAASTRFPKIVVVPFHNETGDAAFDRVAKGVSDAAVARLATPERVMSLLVIGNADVPFSFKPREMKATGESLGAQYLLLGQLKKDGRGFRVVAHLIRVSDQTHLWAKTYDSDTLDLPQQAVIAEAIAGTVADQFSKRPANQTVSR